MARQSFRQRGWLTLISCQEAVCEYSVQAIIYRRLKMVQLIMSYLVYVI